MSTRLTLSSMVVLLSVFSGCNDGTNNPVGPPEGPGLGVSCTAETKCRTSLTCDATPVTGASGNVTMPRPVTAAMRQYVPDGYDGHFVVFRNPAATTDAARFVGRVLRGEVPTVPEP
jgi:hypothetical protein